MEDDEILKELRAVRQAIVRKHDNDLTKIAAAMNARSTSTVPVDLKPVARKLIEKVSGH
jgi:hypothetical protein